MNKDGGPAFPGIEKSIYDHGPSREPSIVEEPTPGMSLRDYFAAQSLGVFSAEHWPTTADAEHIAGIAYAIADAMLAARQKR